MRARILCCGLVLALGLVGDARGGDSPKKAMYKRIAGEYQGLYYGENAYTNSAYISAVAGTDGMFRGKLYYEGRRFDLGVGIDELGAAALALMRADISVNMYGASYGGSTDIDWYGFLQVEFERYGSAESATASLSDLGTGGLNVDMPLYRATYSAKTNPAPQAGAYTLLLSDPAPKPGISGAGFATVSVDKNGKLIAKGTLPDARKFTQQVRVGPSGEWPCYADLHSAYDVGASVLGWLRFDPQAEPGPGRYLPGGVLAWSRPAAPPYLQKTEQSLDVEGSKFEIPASGNVLSFSEGVVVLEGGGLSEPLASTFRLGPKNKVTDTSGNRLRLTFNKRDGSFAGSVFDLKTRARLKFNGVVTQRVDKGFGIFVGTERQTGMVTIQGTQN